MSTVFFVIAMTCLGVFALLAPVFVWSAVWESDRARLRILACWGITGCLGVAAAVVGAVGATV